MNCGGNPQALIFLALSLRTRFMYQIDVEFYNDDKLKENIQCMRQRTNGEKQYTI